jgi:hypothetical protein
MIRAVARSVLVLSLLAGVGYAGTPAAPAATSVQAHKAKAHHHKKKVRKARRKHRRHHKAKHAT